MRLAVLIQAGGQGFLCGVGLILFLGSKGNRTKHDVRFLPAAIRLHLNAQQFLRHALHRRLVLSVVQIAELLHKVIIELVQVAAKFCFLFLLVLLLLVQLRIAFLNGRQHLLLLGQALRLGLAVC